MDIGKLLSESDIGSAWVIFILILIISLKYYVQLRMLVGDLVLITLKAYPFVVRAISRLSSDRVSKNLPLVIELPLTRMRNPTPMKDSRFLMVAYAFAVVSYSFLSGTEDGWFTRAWWIANSLITATAIVMTTIVLRTAVRQERKLQEEGTIFADQLQSLTVTVGSEGFYFSQVMVAMRAELSYRTSSHDIAAGILRIISGDQFLSKNLFAQAKKLSVEFESKKLIRKVTGRIVESGSVDYFRFTKLGARVAKILEDRNGEPLEIRQVPGGIRFTVPQPYEKKNEN